MNSLLNRISALLNPMASSSLQRRKSRTGCYKPRLEVLEGRLALATLELSGTFNLESISGTVGADLASIVGHDNGWTLALAEVTYSQAEESNTRGCDYDTTSTTRVHATSFQFAFTGSDAALLNESVGQNFVGGGLTDGVIFEATNVTCTYSRVGDDDHCEYTLHLVPADPTAGVSLVVQALWTAPFPKDSNGYPDPTTLSDQYATTILADQRSGNGGWLASFDDTVAVEHDGFPPPTPPTLTISDISAREGDRSTNWMLFSVTLSAASNQQVAVSFTTADGTATAADLDYRAQSGTIIFDPGQVTQSIAVPINGDRKREADETLLIQLSNPIGADILDGTGLGTIVNDDQQSGKGQKAKVSAGENNSSTLLAAYHQFFADWAEGTSGGWRQRR